MLAALQRIGWSIKRQSGGSHRILERPGWPDVVFGKPQRDPWPARDAA
ncbi:MAG: type II toxin-antitoxin system HicA family toxin [Planctomycetaceae bacterium]|nr:type II toxin-antitoxin system HicA family toxin [Planctomycetaceae bacterium]